MLAIPRSRFYVKTTELIRAYISLKFFSLDHFSNKKAEFFNVMSNELDRKYVTAFSSCRMALYFGLKALDLRPADEVLLTPITIPDIVNAIATQGLKPVFVDMDKDTHNICIEDLKRKLTSKSKVVLITYLSGISPNMDQIMSCCSENNLTVVEDFSQGYGGQYMGKKLGSFGHFSVGSLTSGKNIGSFIGGLFTTDDRNLFDKVCSKQSTLKATPSKSLIFHYIKDHLVINFATSKVLFSFITYPYLLITRFLRRKSLRYLQLEREIENYNSSRTDIFCDIVPERRQKMPDEFFFNYTSWQSNLALKLYSRVYSDIDFRRKLADSFFSELSATLLAKHLWKNHADHNLNTYYHVPFWAGDKIDLLMDYLLKRGIDCTGYGLNLCSEENAFKDFHSLCEMAYAIKNKVIFIPIHDSFTVKTMKRIAQAINCFYLSSDELVKEHINS